MKLTSIQTSNFIGARAIDVKLVKPVILFSGKNGAGKSSVQEAVRMALVGESVRVSLKKDYASLITEGQDAGYVTVEWEGGEASVVLPKGDRHLGGNEQISGVLPYVLDAQRFATLSDNDRRAFLFGLMGLKTDGPAVKDRLIARKCDAKKVEQILPLLRAGFDVGQKEAQTKARECKAQWKTVTGGETYGSVKAASWKAEKQEVGQSVAGSASDALAKIEAELEAETMRFGELASWEKKCKEQTTRLAELRVNAGRFARIQDKLILDEAELKQWSAKVEATRAKATGGKHEGHHECPECGCLLQIKGEGLGAKLVPYTPPSQQADPEAAASLPEYERALKLFENSVTNGKRDLAAAETAARTIAEIEAAGLIEIPGEEEVIKLKANIEGLKQRRTIHQVDIRKQEDAARQASEADKRTAAATGHHASVQAWDAIADALAPDGIPGEMLAEALGPINARLAQSAASAEWLRIAIDKNMTIWAANSARTYCMLSESEKWRADAMIAEAVSHLSGVKLLCLDRADVLDAKGREDVLYWLADLADSGEVDTALIFATLKSLPSNLPNEIQGFWIENGQVKEALCLAA